MPAISNPYYAKHQILTGQYAKLGQFVLDNGNDYVGGYHILPTDQFFTGFSPTLTSVELYIKKFNIDESVKTYNKVQGIKSINSTQPISYLVRPTLEDYNEGYVYRFFIQKRNNPLLTTMEIDSEQYNTINSQNKPGINGVIWNAYLIKWKITGASIEEHNHREIVKSITDGFIGLQITHLKNLLQFAK